MNPTRINGPQRTPEKKVPRKIKKPRPPGFWARVSKLVLKSIWAFGWRIGTVLFLILAISTAYYYSSLPAAESLVDGRTKGSITFFDRNRKIFSWWGEQFGGKLTVDRSLLAFRIVFFFKKTMVPWSDRTLGSRKLIIRQPRGLLVFTNLCKILVSIRFCGVCAR